MASKDRGLSVDLTGGLLTITIGAAALCQALKGGDALTRGSDIEPRITDEDAFLRAVVAELEREEEDGSTRLHRLFDAAAAAAIDDGAEGIVFPDDEDA